VFTPPTIETERLWLRPFRDTDVDASFLGHDSPEVQPSLRIANHAVAELANVILSENRASELVSRQLGSPLREERGLDLFSSFPSEPHGIWSKPRP